MKPGSNKTAGLNKQLIFNLLVLCLPIIILLPGIAGFSYPGKGGVYSDISISHYPYAVYLLDTMIEHHSIPLWSSLSFSGSPFAANPLSGLWYPPGWLALLLPLPLGFNLMVIVHLIFGAVGLFTLTRAEGLSIPAALFSGLIFASLPKLFAHFGAGHLTLLYAVPWTPWLLYACRSHLTGAHLFGIRSIISWEAPILALIFLADPRWAIYSGLIWWAYSLWGMDLPANGLFKFLLPKKIIVLIFRTMVVALLTAPLAIPLMELTKLTTRSALLPEEALVYSLPWARLLGVFLPEFKGFHEYVLYLGQLVIILLFFSILHKKPNLHVRFWFFVALIALLFSLGKNIPPVSLFTRLPLMEYLRVPSRALFIFGLSGAVLAGCGLQGLLENDVSWRKAFLNLGLAAYLALLISFSLGIFLLSGRIPPNLIWAALWALASVIWIKLYLKKKLAQRTWLLGIYLLCVIELWSVNSTLLHSRPKLDVLTQGQAAAQRIQELAIEKSPYRIYSPSYSIPQQTAAEMGLELADGVDPLQLGSYVDFMNVADGVPNQGYSVTLPPFRDGFPAIDNAKYTPDARLLGVLNVHFLAAEYPLDAQGLTLVDRIDTTWIYQNEFARPRAWIEPFGNANAGTYSAVEDLRLEPNQIIIKATGPGLLVLSEIVYPGWRVWINGEAAEIQAASGLLRSVSLSAGQHQIIFSFVPISLYVGLAVGLLSWLVVLFVLLKNRSKNYAASAEDGFSLA